MQRKNITISIPEDIYRRARVWAAARGTSVSALFTTILYHLPENHHAKRHFQVLASLANLDEPLRPQTRSEARGETRDAAPPETPTTGTSANETVQP